MCVCFFSTPAAPVLFSSDGLISWFVCASDAWLIELDFIESPYICAAVLAHSVPYFGDNQRARARLLWSFRVIRCSSFVIFAYIEWNSLVRLALDAFCRLSAYASRHFTQFVRAHFALWFGLFGQEIIHITICPLVISLSLLVIAHGKRTSECGSHRFRTKQHSSTLWRRTFCTPTGTREHTTIDSAVAIATHFHSTPGNSTR